MRSLLSVLTVLALTAGRLLAQPAATESVELAVGKQRTITPGFAIGDVNGTRSAVADFVVGRGRLQITLVGQQPGTASVAVWDQHGRHRLDITISVVRELEPELVEALRGFPDVRLLTLQGQPVLNGDVANAADLERVRGLARAAGIECLVAARPSAEVAAPAPPAKTPPLRMEYDLRLIEADRQFTTKAYGSGVQPSGRELYRTMVVATQGATAQTFIGGRAVAGKGKSKDVAPSSTPEVGLRISLTPRAHRDAGIETDVAIDTNLPIASTVYVSSEWRRFRESFETTQDVPLAITGNDLLAAPPPPDGSKARDASLWLVRISGLPGVNDVKGASQVPVFSSLIASVGYRKGRTQLVLVIRPRILAPGTE